MEGIESVFACGQMASFTLAKDADVSEDDIAKALKSKRMQLEDFDSELRTRPAVAWAAKVKGIT